MKKIGKVYFDCENKIIVRKPTPSNLLENAGSDNDLYLGNLSQEDVVKELEKILNISDLRDNDGKFYILKFYEKTVDIIFKINNQQRISFRIQGKDRLYGMIKYCNEFYSINLDIEKIFIKLDFKNMTISFINGENYQ